MKCSEFIKRYSSGYPYRFKNFLGEVWELVEAFQTFDKDEILEEFGDSIMTFQLWLAWQIPFDLPMVIPAYVFRKYDARMEGWKVIFANEGLTFYPKYLINGGNFKREHKREAALNLARIDQR